MSTKTLSILLMASCIVSIIQYFVITNKSDRITEKDNLITALNAKVETWKDKDSLNHAKIQVLETEKVRDFISIKSSDSTIVKLQALVKEYKNKIKNQGSITHIGSETGIEGSAPTIITKIDSIYPTYTSNFNLKGWVTGTTVSDKNKTTIDLKVKNEYSVIVGEERQGLFKPKKPFVEVINRNPYTETTALRTYQVTQKPPKKFGIGPVAAYGVELNGTPSFGVFVGIGLQYNLIRF